MSESSWGLKRHCPACLVWFYDFSKDPIICPGCEGSFAAVDFVKLKLSRSDYTSPIKKKHEPVTFEEGDDSKTPKAILDSTDDLPDDLSDEDDDDTEAIAANLDINIDKSESDDDS